ncbi:MAG: tyrosine--tRNA ligase, partial [Promethearchaeota archaeon]
MDPESAFKLIQRKPTQEILTEERLMTHLQEGTPLKHYIGFEISGFVHLGTGLLCMQKVADFQQAGVDTQIFLADYHSWINGKLGGDLSTIREVAGGYFREALKMSLQCVGGDPDKTRFILGSDLYERLGREYLETLIRVSLRLNLARARGSITIMGRKEGESISFGQLLYAPMQVADIYSLGVNLAHGGMPQRKAHVIAIDVASSFAYKPLAVHHYILMGTHITAAQRERILKAKNSGDREGYEDGLIDIKMSKSKPQSAIFIHDTEEEIRRKIRKAFCPAKELELNSVMSIQEFIVWPHLMRQRQPLELINKRTGEPAHRDYSGAPRESPGHEPAGKSSSGPCDLKPVGS